MDLRVVEHFDSIQGEGLHAGVPAVFLRLAGCNLACPYCDTLHSWDTEGKRLTHEMAVAILHKRAMAVITGGEPLLQKEAVMALSDAARVGGTRVHLETNGTIRLTAKEVKSFDWITVSPKSMDTVEDAVIFADEIKILCGDGAFTADQVVAVVRLVRMVPWCVPVVVQPLEVSDVEQTKANMKATVQVVRDINDASVRVGVQLHKMMDWR